MPASPGLPRSSWTARRSRHRCATRVPAVRQGDLRELLGGGLTLVAELAVHGLTIFVVEWPIIFATTKLVSPAWSSEEANVRRRSLQLTLGTPARRHAAARSRSGTLGQGSTTWPRWR